MSAILDANDISKRFGSFQALKPMNFQLAAGEVRALVGSNGAGKTTLVKLLTGAHSPTSGHIRVANVALPGGDPAAHIAGGIACIYQHSSLAPNLTVAENLFLGSHPKKWGSIVDKKAIARKAENLIEENQTGVRATDLVGDLPTVKQKEVEILKALARNSQVILMDEPTAWLSFKEVERLHDTIRRLKEQKVATVYISHMMDEIFKICDTASILRDGGLVWEGEVAKTDRAEMVKHMLGTSGQDTTTRQKSDSNSQDEALRVSALSKKGVFDDISFSLNKGEILCLTGLIGSRRTELVRCLFGADQPDMGDIYLDDNKVKIRSPRHAIEKGIGFVPEDRHRQGLFMSHTIEENLIVAALGKFMRGVLKQNNQIRQTADDATKALNIQPPEPQKVVGTLSGGNQQKVLLGKWLETTPQIIILDEPTVGVDVGAKSDIYQVLEDLKQKGVAVLVVSSDIEEVQNIADRVLVMDKGKLIKTLNANEINHQTLVTLISGVQAS